MTDSAAARGRRATRARRNGGPVRRGPQAPGRSPRARTHLKEQRTKRRQTQYICLRMPYPLPSRVRCGSALPCALPSRPGTQATRTPRPQVPAAAG
eukprot:scaffold114715_cov63-Phaeocystis_antarctica.AAC.7